MELQEQIERRISLLTKHEYVRLTDRGNSAIFLALQLVKSLGKKAVILQDMGGWFTHRDYAKKLGFEIVVMKTDNAFIEQKELENCLKTHKDAVLVFSSLGAYAVPQNMDMILHTALLHKCMLIEDMSGSIGMEKFNRQGMDIKVCSTGKWKAINLEYGGFITVKEKVLFAKLKTFDSTSFNDAYLEKLLMSLKNVSTRLEFLKKKVKEVKEDLKGYDIIHRDAQGLVVIVRYRNVQEKNKLIEYCKKKKLDHTECPRDIRILEKAISIEVKRLGE